MRSLLSYILVCKLIIHPSVSYGIFSIKTCKVVFILFTSNISNIFPNFIVILPYNPIGYIKSSFLMYFNVKCGIIKLIIIYGGVTNENNTYSSHQAALFLQARCLAKAALSKRSTMPKFRINIYKNR